MLEDVRMEGILWPDTNTAACAAATFGHPPHYGFREADAWVHFAYARRTRRQYRRCREGGSYKSLAANETHYPPNNGTVELRRAIAAHMEKRNLAYGEDEIIVTCGATEALFAALSSILNPGDEVLVPTPAFGLYESIIS